MRKCADNGRKNVFQDQEVIVFNSQIKMQIFYSCRNQYIPMHVCDRTEMFIVLSVRYLWSVRSLVACFGSKISICKKNKRCTMSMMVHSDGQQIVGMADIWGLSCGTRSVEPPWVKSRWNFKCERSYQRLLCLPISDLLDPKNRFWEVPRISVQKTRSLELMCFKTVWFATFNMWTCPCLQAAD